MLAGGRAGVSHSYVALLVVEGMSSNVCVLLLFVALLSRVVYCNLRSVHTVDVFKCRVDVLVCGGSPLNVIVDGTYTTPYLGMHVDPATKVWLRLIFSPETVTTFFLSLQCRIPLTLTLKLAD